MTGRCFVHTVIDDHSRVAYAEIHDNEKAVTAVEVLQRTTEWFGQRGIIVERVTSDNGSAYRSKTMATELRGVENHAMVDQTVSTTDQWQD